MSEAVGYDETTSTREVVFSSEKTYGYFEVPKTVYLQLMASDFKGSYIAILAGVVNFLPHPNSPRTRSLGSKKFTNDLGLLYAI
jgi:KTSC domain